MLRYVPSLPTLLRVFIMDVEFYQLLFLHLLKWSCGFCPFLLIWCFILIDLHMLNYQPWNESGFIVVYDSFLCIVGFGFLVCLFFLRIFTSIFIKDISLQFSFFVVSLFDLLSGWWWLHRMTWECFLLFKLLEWFEGDWQEFFFICLVECPSEAIRFWTLVCREYFLNYRFYLTSSDQSVQVICFFLTQIW